MSSSNYSKYAMFEEVLMMQSCIKITL